MKINCTQCGAEQIVLESNFFLRCPYCDARIIVDPPENTPALVEPAVSEEYVRRLFPSNAVSSAEIKFFPYLEKAPPFSRKTRSCFSQPWQELEDYIPPSGDKKVFDESLAEPDQLIPFDRDMAEESGSRIVFHPIYVVMLKLEGYEEGLLVDGVSGKLISESPLIEDNEDSEKNLYGTFLRTLAIGLVFTIPIYLLTRNLDHSWLSRIWTFMVIIPLVLAFYYIRIKAGRR